MINAQQPTQPEFDAETAQDLLTAAIQQRDSAMNGLTQAQAVLAKKEREITDLKSQLATKKTK